MHSIAAKHSAIVLEAVKKFKKDRIEFTRSDFRMKLNTDDR